MKSMRSRSTFAVAALALALILVALPASAATRPQDIRTQADLAYDVSRGTMLGEGDFSSEGLFPSGWTKLGPCDSYYKWHGRWVVRSGIRCGYV
jgi:hypothetical protein